MVVSGVAERTPEKLARLVYVDAFLPEHGESAFDQMAPAFVATLKKRAADRGEGWAIASNDGKGPPQPIGPREERISLTRSEEHTSALQSLMRPSYSVLCLRKNITSRLSCNIQQA